MKYIALLLSLLPAGIITSSASAEPVVAAAEDLAKTRGNVAIIRQGGSTGSNSVTINQSGSNNMADVFQEGENNIADVTQEGAENRLNATQTGNNNQLKRKQTGHSVTTINQNGDVSTHEHDGTVSETH